MTNKTVVVEKKEKGNSEKTDVLEAGSQKEGVGKSPEPQTVLNVSGEKVQSDVPFNSPTNEDAKEVHLNHVGQKIDAPLSEASYYVTPQGKHMVVQMEEGDNVFAGEHGRNAEWYPKSVVGTWAKHEPVKVKAEKESGKESEKEK
jgi:hypothetical protein